MLSVHNTHTNNNNNNNGMKLWEVMDMSVTLMVMMISSVYTYPQTHQFVFIKYVQLFTCHTFPNKVVQYF